MFRSATNQTSPPDPPSPPSGPPRGTWASRRNETLPAPPSPAFAWRPHSSTNWDIRSGYGERWCARLLNEMHRIAADVRLPCRRVTDRATGERRVDQEPTPFRCRRVTRIAGGNRDVRGDGAAVVPAREAHIVEL